MTQEPGTPTTDPLTAQLIERLTAMADDELVLGHRNSEWTGHAPLLEEDIALANLAQDEIGHAVVWYGLRTALDGSDPDELVFGRDAGAYRSSRLVSLPRGDWAFTMLRQFVFDSYEAELLTRLEASAWKPLAEAAAKVSREELFHLRHSRLWLERLALGTDESRRRLNAAAALVMPALAELLAPLPGDAQLAAAGYFPAAAEVAAAVGDRLNAAFAAVSLEAEVQLGDLSEWQSKRTEQLGDASVASGQTQTSHLPELLATMQSVARADPGAETW